MKTDKTDNEFIEEIFNANDDLIIALFDGWYFDSERWIYPNLWIEKYIDGINNTIQVRRHDKTFVSTFPSLKYSTSWDWLMPVVEKINKLHSEKFKYDPILMAKGIFPDDNEYMDVICLPLSTSIEEAYNAVVKFIKNYPYEKDKM